MKVLKSKSYLDFTKGTWDGISPFLAPENSVKLGMNVDSDYILGSLVSRKGSTLIRTLNNSYPILGLHNYRNSQSGVSTLFGAISDGTNTDIYDVVSGTKSLQDDTKDLKTRFLTYMDNCLRLNGTDIPKSYNGVVWYTPKTAVFTSSLDAVKINTFTVDTTTEIITSVSHGFSTGDAVFATTTGTLPAPLATSTAYYVKVITADTYYLYTNSTLTSIVNFTTTGSGTNTLTSYTFLLTSPSHGLSNGDVIKLKTTGTLPSGTSTNTPYYVKDVSTNYFHISRTLTGSSVIVSNVGSGTLSYDRWDTFDLSNMPSGSKYAIEFKDKVYVAGRSDFPDRVDISSVTSPTTRSISWTSGNSFIVFEQEDGGGGITGLAKVPGYVLVFKKRTLKRWDGSSAYPEDMVNQGAPSQEAIVTAKGLCFWVNENGAWVTQGGDPKKISSYSVDNIIKSCSSTDLVNVASGTDEEHIFWSFPTVTIGDKTYNNVVLKYNILQNSWDVRSYPWNHRVYCKYVDTSGSVFTVFGSNYGAVYKLDTGESDDGVAITWEVHTQDYYFGYPMLEKSVTRIGIITEDVSNAHVQWRNTHKSSDWKPLAKINSDVTDINQIDIRGIFYNLKFTESRSKGRATLKGIYFPEGIKVTDNTNK